MSRSTPPTSGLTSELDSNMFRAYDIRGIVDQSLTEAAVQAIGHALGSEAWDRGERAIAVARDGRLSGPRLVDALANGLMAAGCDVIDLGRVPTPVGYYAAATLEQTNSCIVVTGSHNPPEYNGIKMVLNGDTLSGDAIQALRQRIENDQLRTAESLGQRSTLDLEADYEQRIVSDIKLGHSMKLVVDCGNGVAGELFPRVLRALGCEVTEMFCEIDGNFPNHHPDPSKPENLQDLIAKVAETGADLGLAFDGDGDRVGVVTSDGKIIFPDRLLILWARDVLSRNPGATIIHDVKSTRFVEQAILEAGGNALLWKTGHSLIKAKLKETGALLAGEMSGHVFFKERWYGFDDALYAGARLLEILSNAEQSPNEIFDALPDAFNTPELNVCMEEGETFAYIDELVKIAEFGDARVTTIDGLRVDFADGWGLVRSSNTTPCLVIRFESDTEEGLERIKEQFRVPMLTVKPDIKLPF